MFIVCFKEFLAARGQIDVRLYSEVADRLRDEAKNEAFACQSNDHFHIHVTLRSHACCYASVLLVVIFHKHIFTYWYFQSHLLRTIAKKSFYVFFISSTFIFMGEFPYNLGLF